MLRLPDAANILNIRNGKTDGKWNSTIYNYCNYEEMWQVQEQRKQMNQVSIWYPPKRQQWFHILMERACFWSNDVVYLHKPEKSNQKLAHTGSLLKQH